MATDELSRIFAALADPTRRAIIERLRGGDATVTELGAPFDMSQPAISKHLRVLEEAGLVKVGRVQQTRPRQLDPAPLQRVNAWLEEYREGMEASLDRLDAYLTKLQSKQPDKEHDHEHDQDQ
jgi:DNA-binding transcriptional ArsR family regulator